MAILSKFLDKEVLVIDDLVLNAPRTKEIAGMLKAIKIGKKTKHEIQTWRCGRCGFLESYAK